MKAINLKVAQELSKKLEDLQNDHKICTNLNAMRDGAYQYKVDQLQTAIEVVSNRLAEVLEPLTAAIKEAEGRATARTITAADIIDTLNDIEHELRISKKAMNGIHIRADINAQKFPGSYKYIPESTHFQATYKNGSWRITSITREVCRQGMHIEVTHTEESRKAILDRMSKF